LKGNFKIGFGNKSDIDKTSITVDKYGKKINKKRKGTYCRLLGPNREEGGLNEWIYNGRRRLNNNYVLSI